MWTMVKAVGKISGVGRLDVSEDFTAFSRLHWGGDTWRKGSWLCSAFPRMAKASSEPGASCDFILNGMGKCLTFLLLREKYSDKGIWGIERLFGFQSQVIVHHGREVTVDRSKREQMGAITSVVKSRELAPTNLYLSGIPCLESGSAHN